MSKIAFLLLTYNEHNKYKNIENFLQEGNIYVHAKEPNNVKSYLKKYIIKEYVKTTWAGFGIVKAEVKLLEAAFENQENKWFVLMSNSCYPLLTYNQLNNELNKNDNKYSFFSYVKEENGMQKTSQFWILNRRDVGVIINTQNKYFELYCKKHVMDERYFLTVLMKEIPDYKYNNKTPTYSRWIDGVNSYHPIIFNRLTPYDKKLFKEKNYFFFRKISDKFVMETITPKSNLWLIYIDSMNDENNMVKKIIDDSSADCIIFYSLYGFDLISPKLKNKAIYLIQVHYLLFDEYYNKFLEDYKDLLKQWKKHNFIKF